MIKKINYVIGCMFDLLGLFGGLIIFESFFNLGILNIKIIGYIILPPRSGHPISAPMIFLAVSAVVGAYLIKELNW